MDGESGNPSALADAVRIIWLQGSGAEGRGRSSRAWDQPARFNGRPSAVFRLADLRADQAWIGAFRVRVCPQFHQAWREFESERL